MDFHVQRFVGGEGNAKALESSIDPSAAHMAEASGVARVRITRGAWITRSSRDESVY